MSSFTVYIRENCGLCEELLAALAPLAARHGLPVQTVDLDHAADPVRQRRYTLKVPVIEWDGVPVGFGHLDAPALEALLARTARHPPSR